MSVKAQMEEIGKHIAVLNDDYTKLLERVVTLEIEVKWIKWISLAILGASLITVVSIWAEFYASHVH